MRIYISHKKNSQFQSELYDPIRNSDLLKHHTFIFPHDSNAESINTKALFQNKECDLVIAEVSYPATGQGIELGWADVYEIPIICLYKDGVEVSGSLSMIASKFLMYTDTENMIKDIEGVIKDYE